MGGLHIGELGNFLVDAGSVNDRTILAVCLEPCCITRAKGLPLTGLTVRQSTSAACPWKLCNWVHVLESQNFTMPMESPDTIVPSLVPNECKQT